MCVGVCVCVGVHARACMGVVGSLSCEIVIGIMGFTSPINLICLSNV